jgi:hypothetical protein
MAKRGRPKKGQDSSVTDVKAPSTENETVDANAISLREPERFASEQINWQDELRDDEIVTDEKNGGTFVLLAGLQRLGRLKGIVSEISDVIKPLTVTDRSVTVKSTITWANGTVSTGLGDAHEANCGSGVFKLYLTPIAESRAFARALRKGLGITMCSKDEISDNKAEDLADLEPAQPHQIELINVLCKKTGKTFLEIMQENDKGFSDPSELTKGQAIKMIGWLQSNKHRKLAKANMS